MFEVTTREYAQTTELLALHGITHEVVGPGHGGAGIVGKGRATTARLHALRGFAKRRDFDLALSHASHELPLVARSLGIPSSYAFDYEFARVQHGLGCRAARRVIVPEAIPQDRLDGLARERGQGAALPRTQGGVLPSRLCSGSVRPRRARARSRTCRRRRSALLRRFRSITATETRSSLTSSTGSARRSRARRRPAANGRAAQRDPGTPTPVARHARQGDRRPQPRRTRRPRCLSRRNDEPRGGRARRSCVHDVRRPAGSSGRRARPRGAARAPDER